mgnify:CR=1 FL=1
MIKSYPLLKPLTDQLMKEVRTLMLKRHPTERLMCISTEKERNIESHLYPGKYGTSLKITVKNTIQTKLRRIYCFILSEMAGETKCPVIMPAVYLQDVKKRFVKIIQT